MGHNVEWNPSATECECDHNDPSLVSESIIEKEDRDQIYQGDNLVKAIGKKLDTEEKDTYSDIKAEIIKRRKMKLEKLKKDQGIKENE